MAEVKVKITAQNEVQTGLQASLAEVRQFAGEAQKTMQQAMQPPRQAAQERVAPTFAPIDLGDYGMGPLREMQEQLKQLRRSSEEAFSPEPAEQFSTSIAGVIGRIALVVGAAATVGKVIASAFDAASAGVKASIGIQEQFNSALQDAGRATSLSGAIAEFKQLNGLAEQTGKTLENTFGKTFTAALANLTTNPSQLLARLGDIAVGGGASRSIQQNQAQQRQIALETLDASLEGQINNATDVADAGGDQEQIDAIQLAQRRRSEIESLQSGLRRAGLPEEDVASRVAKQNEINLLQDQIAANEQRLETEKEITREKERQQKLASGTREGNVIGKQLGPGSFEGAEDLQRERDAAQREVDKAKQDADRKSAKAAEFNQNTKLLEARAAKDKKAEEALLVRDDLTQGFAATGNFEDASRFAEAAATLRAQQDGGAQAGSVGASSLQRIGFASGEFFDTRSKDDTAAQIKTVGNVVKEIGQLLKKENVLLMKSEF